jgi:hypothetical protein
MKTRSTLRRKPSSDAKVIPLRRTRAGAGPAVATALGRLAGLGAGGEPWIDLPEQGRTALAARSTVPLDATAIGREVLVAFAGDGFDRPVVVGVVRQPNEPTAPAPAPARTDAIVDGERIVLTGQKEVVLRCGKASIALLADGQVVIKGVKLLAAASGLHRIRGGSVQIN